MMSLPDDLVSVHDAATMSERTPRTIRRWAKAGLVTRYEGEAPEGGGAAAVLVSRSELLAYLAASNQQPRPTSEPSDAGSDEASDTSEVTPDKPDESRSDMGSDIAVLRVRLEASQQLAAAQIELATLRAELVAARAECGLLEEQLRHAAARTEDMMLERDDWRERHDAREAELRALRQVTAGQSGTWWTRLLGGPVATAK